MKKYCALLFLAILGLGIMPCTILRAVDAPTVKSAKDKDKESGEIKVAFNLLPAAVQTTLTKEAAGNTIKDADQETKDGKTTYEADVVINGTNYEIVVATDGTLIR